MKGPINAPDNFTPYEDIFLYDDFGRVKEEVKQAIYMKPFFSYLVMDEDYFCSVYWNDTVGYWCGELWGPEGYVDTYICDSPEQIKEEVLADYDCGFEEWE
jgi:hypothetical protein